MSILFKKSWLKYREYGIKRSRFVYLNRSSRPAKAGRKVWAL